MELDDLHATSFRDDDTAAIANRIPGIEALAGADCRDLAPGRRTEAKAGRILVDGSRRAA
jgi:hypothetical protein